MEILADETGGCEGAMSRAAAAALCSQEQYEHLQY